jgi:glutamate-1-semialdehyde 2,1-aminomutase
MLAEGVALPPGAYEALFVGAAHTDEILEQVGDAATRAAATVAAGLA